MDKQQVRVYMLCIFVSVCVYVCVCGRLGLCVQSTWRQRSSSLPAACRQEEGDQDRGTDTGVETHLY